jgi:hypothetical protein
MTIHQHIRKISQPEDLLFVIKFLAYLMQISFNLSNYMTRRQDMITLVQSHDDSFLSLRHPLSSFGQDVR